MLQVDDPKLLRAENARLKALLEERDEEIIQLRELLRPPEWYPPVELGLAKQEARIIATMFKANGELVTKERLFYSIYHDQHEQPELKIIDVFICKLRKKLKDYGVEIETRWGQGYHLTASGVKILKEWGVDNDEAIAA